MTMPLRRAAPLAAALALLVPAAGGAQPPAEREVGRAVADLLDAYARKDLARVMARVDSARIVMFGTDAAEVHRGGAAFARQMRFDFVLWDSSRFAPVRALSVEDGGRTATAFFEVPWTAYRAGRPAAYLLRFATTWRRAADARWRLVQTMNAVATEGRSAADLARPAPPR